MIRNRIHIIQGGHAVGTGPDFVIATLLGSCVSCCLWDPVAGVGGMNHMLLAVSPQGDQLSNLQGINAMELLINDILKQGGRRDRLNAKAFGGARMLAGLSDIGMLNAEFTLDFLSKEGITCLGHSLGGTSARTIRFWPGTGRVLQRVSRETPDETVFSPAASTSDSGIELW